MFFNSKYGKNAILVSKKVLINNEYTNFYEKNNKN